MSLKGYVKRKKYFKEKPIVYSQYKELIRDNMTEKGLSETKYMAIKRYAIEHTLFYKDYMPDDVFPIMTKTDYIKHHDEIRSDEKFDKPLHIISTSGSTGIPFSVEQNYEKRARLIAELKYMGKLVGYQSHEKMLQLRAYHGIEFERNLIKDYYQIENGEGFAYAYAYPGMNRVLMIIWLMRGSKVISSIFFILV